MNWPINPFEKHYMDMRLQPILRTFVVEEGPSADDEKHFEVLALDYEMAREDERTFQNIQAAVVGLTVALLAAVATIVSDACELQHEEEKGCKHLPPLFLAGAPSIPLATLAFLQLLGVVAALRSYYLRAIERELRGYTKSSLSDLIKIGPIRPGSYMGLMTEVTTMRRGRAGYRILSVMIMLIALGFFGGLTCYIAIHLGGAYGKAMFVFYGLAFGLLIADVWAATLGARSTFVKIADRFVARHLRSGSTLVQRPSAEGRSLASYLILPRPEDCIKWLFIPIVFILASWSRGGPYYWDRMFFTLLIVEFLVYSARYQWNDVRGIEEDSGHPAARERRRLPFMKDVSQLRVVVYSSLITATARVISAVILGSAIGATTPTLRLIAGVFMIAAVYETLRAIESHHYVRRNPNLAHYAIAAGLWLLVGLGYVIRFLAGLDAANIPPLGPLTFPGAAFAFCFGIMFVLLTWVLEAASYCRKESDLLWYVVDDESLRAKPHLVLLLSFLSSPKVQFEVKPGAPSFGDRKHISVLEQRGASKLWAPWNLAYFAASIGGVFLGARLSGGELPSLGIVVLSAIFAATVGFIGLAKAWQITVVVLLLAAMTGAAEIDMSFDSKRAMLLILPWAIATMTYVGFRRQSYGDLKKFLKDLTEWGKGIVEWVMSVVVGGKTWGKVK
ncbi:hypothetical protein [Streptomyces sp. NPDC019890]|uniref:hypothetical protein n=1 Tax=Streptomyces sp. NPDC019890 TaxID=3365064 RepID=UPI00384B0539